MVSTPILSVGLFIEGSGRPEGSMASWAFASHGGDIAAPPSSVTTFQVKAKQVPPEAFLPENTGETAPGRLNSAPRRSVQQPA